MSFEEKLDKAAFMCSESWDEMDDGSNVDLYFRAGANWAKQEFCGGGTSIIYKEGFEDGYKRANRNIGWQPIETAPKDGIRVLCYLQDQNLFESDNIEKCLYTTKDDCDDDDSPCWRFDSMEPLQKEDGPTHWMPLPEPPANLDNEASSE